MRVIAVLAVVLLGHQKALAQSIQPIYSFPQGPATPYAALVAGPDGNFYGTTWAGGAGGEGTVFKFTTNGIVTALHSFTGGNASGSPNTLTLGPDGNFYGTTSNGGADEIGELYRLDLPPEIIQPPASQSAVTGAPVSLSVTLFGTGPYSFQWLSNNIPIVTATNSTLIIPSFAAGDAANYSVVVSNAWGSSTSVVAALAVVAAPVIAGVTLSANGNVILACQSQTNVVSRLWATTNLAVPEAWTPIFTNSVTSASGAWQFTDTNSPLPQRYYRVSTP